MTAPLSPAGMRLVWVVTLAAAAILMVTMGARQSLGLFVSPPNSSTGLGSRGKHPIWVFPDRGRRIRTTNNNGWQEARREAGLRPVRVHDLRHNSESRIIPSVASVAFGNRRRCSTSAARGV